MTRLDSTLAFLLLVTFVIAVLWVAARRAITVADLQIDDGAVRILRGGVAPPILADLQDIARRPPIRSLRISILRSSGRAEVRLRGAVTPEQAQRIRNVVGSVPLARLANARRR